MRPAFDRVSTYPADDSWSDAEPDADTNDAADGFRQDVVAGNRPDRKPELRELEADRGRHGKRNQDDRGEDAGRPTPIRRQRPHPEERERDEKQDVRNPVGPAPHAEPERGQVAKTLERDRPLDVFVMKRDERSINCERRPGDREDQQVGAPGGRQADGHTSELRHAISDFPRR